MIIVWPVVRSVVIGKEFSDLGHGVLPGFPGIFIPIEQGDFGVRGNRVLDCYPISKEERIWG